MSETSPLLDQNHADEEYYVEEDFGLSPRTKYTLYGVGGVFSVAILYFFTIVLPDMFIPQPVQLEDFIKIGSSQVQLEPVESPLLRNDLPVYVEYEDVDYEVDYEEADVENHSESDVESHDESIYTQPSSKLRSVRRMILIGDIHGHLKELRKLLKKLTYNPKKDYLLVLGDFVAKGPDSLEVIEFLSKNNADCILGNHEYYLLQNYVRFHGLEFPDFVVNETHESVSPYGFTAAGFNDDPEFLLAKKLEPKHVQYINNCSLIKTLGDVPYYRKKQVHGIFKGISTTESRTGIAVHGGVRWDLPLAEQDPTEVLEMRSLIGPYYNQSTDDPHEKYAVSWSKIWNKKQNKSKTPLVAYYGHDARRGLNVKPYARGFDTGCDRGEQLLAVVMWSEEVDGQVVYREKVEQVKC